MDQNVRIIVNHFCLTLLFVPIMTNAQNWSNPADRYANEHKKYLNAQCPIPASNIMHFVYFARDREAIKGHAFLSNQRFNGAQIMYSWRQLEPVRDVYDFTVIEKDIAYLNFHNKKLFIQLQDATFHPEYKAVPDYLLTEEFDHGAVEQLNDQNVVEGWVAKRWNSNVRERFARLLTALGKQFDGKIAGINLQETAIGIDSTIDSSFTERAYVDGIKANMQAMKNAFTISTTLIYANFIPGEWLPWNDKGYLKSIYDYGNEIGVGLGAPDLMPMRRGQLNHALALMHEGNFQVPLGIAIQDGNYIGKTGADSDYEEKSQLIATSNIVPFLYGFANEFLKVNYLFWVDQEPYFQKDVLPCFGN